MDMIGKIYACRILRQVDNISLRRENKCFILKNIYLYRLKKIVMIRCGRFIFNKFCYPFKLLVYILFVLSPDLYFQWAAIPYSAI